MEKKFTAPIIFGSDVIRNHFGKEVIVGGTLGIRGHRKTAYFRVSGLTLLQQLGGRGPKRKLWRSSTLVTDLP